MNSAAGLREQPLALLHLHHKYPMVLLTMVCDMCSLFNFKSLLSSCVPGLQKEVLRAVGEHLPQKNTLHLEVTSEYSGDHSYPNYTPVILWMQRRNQGPAGVLIHMEWSSNHCTCRQRFSSVTQQQLWRLQGPASSESLGISACKMIISACRIIMALNRHMDIFIALHHACPFGLLESS